MKKIIVIVLIINGFWVQLFGQERNDKNSLFLTKEFMRMVFDLQPFDSIVKLTILNKDMALARFKYSSAYFSLINLQLQIQKNEYSYSELSYIPYSVLSPAQRTLVYEKFIDGIPSNIDFSSIYAIYEKNRLVTYLESKNGKISGIKSYYSQGGADYIHQFAMQEIDSDSSIAKLDSFRPAKGHSKISNEEGLSIALNFIKFAHDSILYSRDVKDVKSSANNFFKFRQKLLFSDTLDFYTIYYSTEYLKEKLSMFSMEELSVIPYSSLPKKERISLFTSKENLEGIYAVKHKKEIITYLCISGDKVKYFLALKNLSGQYVFLPYEASCNF